MSVVSGIVLCTSSCEEDDEDDNCILWDRVNAWLAERSFGPLARVERQSGGTKHPQMFIGCAGFNHFASYEDEFAAFVLSLDWDCPENVVLVIEPEEGETRVWRPDLGH